MPIPEEKQRKLQNLKVLITEDDPDADLLLCYFLDRTAGEILHARTGNESVELCLIHPDIDLVLMDIRIPEMDGYEAVRQIRKFNKTVVIIAQTAFALAGEKEKSLESGCNDYISKPIREEVLLSMIDKHLKLLKQDREGE